MPGLTIETTDRDGVTVLMLAGTAGGAEMSALEPALARLAAAASLDCTERV